MLKSKANFNYITIMSIVAVITITALTCYMSISASTRELKQIKNDMKTVYQNNDEISDVEGYGLIVKGIVYGVSSTGTAIAIGIFVVIPLLLAGFIFAFATIARLIYASFGWRLIVYRILMGFAYLGVISVITICLAMFNMSNIVCIIIGAFGIYSLIILVLGIINTYTKRIRNLKKEDILSC